MEKKDPQVTRIELKRSWTQFKMRMIPFIRTLGPDFYARVVLFSGISYIFWTQMYSTINNRVKLKQEGKNSATRFSKTFSKE